MTNLSQSTSSQMREIPLYLSDVMDGVVAALVLRGIKVLPNRDNKLDLAFEKLFADIEEESKSNSLDVRFVIQTDPHHGDSEDVQEELVAASKRNLISLDNPEFQVVRFKVTPEKAPGYLNALPGNPGMYNRLAERLLEHFRSA
jgi:hypothetical protein